MADLNTTAVEWKDSYIYGEQYQVSSTGLVRNKTTGRILTPSVDKKGYLRVRLSLHDKKVSAKVHRMVAVAFIPNPEQKPQVNHKDGNKENNRAENLEWISNYDNMQHAVNNGLTKRVEYSGRRKKAIIGVDGEGKIVKFESLELASDTLQLSKSNLCNALKGKRKRCGGYVWRYSDKEPDDED